MAIYTKTGDAGFSTVNATRLQKSDIYFELLGELDLLNVYLGLLAVHVENEEGIINTLLQIQKNLIMIGSHVGGYLPEISKIELEIDSLEKNIDVLDSQNVPLHQFIIPSGNFCSVLSHLIRVIVRKCERYLIKVKEQHKVQIDTRVQQYLNRLSDYCFVLARYLNNKGKNDKTLN
ncbi:Cob(I)yrinic acid a,c-diamide adenosyltransferase [Candidatus Hepatincola sp. Pdp]